MRKHRMQKTTAENSGGRKGVRRSRHGVARTGPRQGRRAALRHLVSRRKAEAPCRILPSEGINGAAVLAALSGAQKERLVRQLTLEL